MNVTHSGMSVVLKQYAAKTASHVVGQTPFQGSEFDDAVALLGFGSCFVHGRTWGNVARAYCMGTNWEANKGALAAMTTRVQEIVTRSMQLVYATEDRDKVDKSLLVWYESFAIHMFKVFFAQASTMTVAQLDFGLALFEGLKNALPERYDSGVEVLWRMLEETPYAGVVEHVMFLKMTPMRRVAAISALRTNANLTEIAWGVLLKYRNMDYCERLVTSWARLLGSLESYHVEKTSMECEIPDCWEMEKMMRAEQRKQDEKENREQEHAFDVRQAWEDCEAALHLINEDKFYKARECNYFVAAAGV